MLPGEDLEISEKAGSVESEEEALVEGADRFIILHLAKRWWNGLVPNRLGPAQPDHGGVGVAGAQPTSHKVVIAEKRSIACFDDTIEQS